VMVGLLLTSLASGQIISRTGRYKVFPILGCGCFTVGLFLLSRMEENTGVFASSGYMFVLGIGLGMVMQVLVLAVQNAVEYRDLGTATSAATFFRTIGSSIGVAVFGAVFTAQLTTHLAIGVPPTATGRCSAAVLSGPSGTLAQCPAEVEAWFVGASRFMWCFCRPSRWGPLHLPWHSSCPRFDCGQRLVRQTPAKRSACLVSAPRFRSYKLRYLDTSAAKTDCAPMSGWLDGRMLILSRARPGCSVASPRRPPVRLLRWPRHRRRPQSGSGM
jgi:hypothetical protein